ncbi:hypothetical protein Dimus_000922 [Dionaea muscipula]
MAAWPACFVHGLPIVVHGAWALLFAARRWAHCPHHQLAAYDASTARWPAARQLTVRRPPLLTRRSRCSPEAHCGLLLAKGCCWPHPMKMFAAYCTATRWWRVSLHGSSARMGLHGCMVAAR